MTPAWILDVLAALMLVVAAVSAARIATARPWRRGSAIADTDMAHLLMAIAMAGMLAPSLSTLPDTGWEVIFGLLIAWFAGRVALDARANGVRALAGGHCAPHLAHSASMLYMFLAATAAGARVSGSTGMGAMSGAGGSATMTLSHPTLAFVFALILVGYAVWDLDQLSGRRYATGARVSLAGVGPVRVPVLAGSESPAGSLPGGRSAAQAAPAADGGPAADGVPAADPAARSAGERTTSSRAGRVSGLDTEGGGFLLSPAVTVGCRIAMGVTMAFMLLIAL